MQKKVERNVKQANVLNFKYIREKSTNFRIIKVNCNYHVPRLENNRVRKS